MDFDHKCSCVSHTCVHVLGICVIRLREDTGVHVRDREKLQNRLEKHAIFQRYLDKVLESADEFHEIREIIARFDTLTATHEVYIHGQYFF